MFVILKHLFIMENTRLLFYDIENDIHLSVKPNLNEIVISITDSESKQTNTIKMSRLTAIKLVKQLKKDIGILNAFKEWK